MMNGARKPACRASVVAGGRHHTGLNSWNGRGLSPLGNNSDRGASATAERPWSRLRSSATTGIPRLREQRSTAEGFSNGVPPREPSQGTLNDGSSFRVGRGSMTAHHRRAHASPLSRVVNRLDFAPFHGARRPAAWTGVQQLPFALRMIRSAELHRVASAARVLRRATRAVYCLDSTSKVPYCRCEISGCAIRALDSIEHAAGSDEGDRCPIVNTVRFPVG